MERDSDYEVLNEHEIFGIKFLRNPKSWKETFKAPFGFDTDGEDIYLESKETFVHEEIGFSFKYKYIIEGMRLDDALVYNLLFVPMPESLCEKKRKAIVSFSGLMNEEDISAYDVFEYGLCVIMGGEVIEIENEDDEFDESIIDNIAEVCTTIDSLRGFYLDKYVNHIGNTGWDVLKDAIKGEDMFRKKMWLKI